MISIIKNISSKAGIDSAIAYTVLSRIIQASGGLIAIIFITKFLSADEQGYYYTFASILAIQIFFELGLSGIITQYTAHEFAHLGWKNNFELYGDNYYKSRLSSLLRFCIKWFAVIAVILFFVLLVIGFYFFSHYNKSVNIEWQKPWVILCLTTSLNLFIDPLLAFFEGLGKVKDMAKVRFIQRIVNILLIFLLFALGFKLYSSAIASLIAISVNYIQIFFSKRIEILQTIWFAKGEFVINYVKEIFPYQWRIALSWISGYFIFQLFNPILFATEGSVVAGQMGMTMQVLNGVSALSMSWITTKVPLFSLLISSKKYNELDIIFNKTLKTLNLVNNFLLFIFIVVILILGYYKVPLRLRLLPTVPLLCILLTVVINQYIFSWATYLRCHKQEPLLIQTIISAVFLSFSTIVFGKLFGLQGIVVPYALWSIVCFFWVYTIFMKKKKEWHQTDDMNCKI